MPQRKARRTLALEKIEQYYKKGYSANKIQKSLQKENLGMRRKSILAEIRLIKKQRLEPAKAQKHIPKKYRTTLVSKRISRPETVYRVSFIIQDVPVHSKPFRRNYLGFRLTAFHVNPNVLINNERALKNTLIKLSSEYLGYDILDWENYTVYIGSESPVQINIPDVRYFNGKWVFRVEKEGRELYERSGYI